ncbi:hypothetical protein WPS_23140 [Vulcanimicrobium alpinum]|uniref:Uncharacterized protein n=1 Tax=Vulcanimicrobium alpinum TaxID=3016050 RepID=A0AAN1XX73_UNVUL|nr:hypothetical protein [Vulcanimicrobium alpinum]BDE07038.1 hypothetical protein WPS_23140 [Vulcanimicrobium alpinum]
MRMLAGARTFAAAGARTFAAAGPLTLALAAGAAGQTVPLTTPPQPGANATANLIFDAMLATARANATNPQAGAAAALSYQHAVQRYNVGDLANARAQAGQALIAANRAAPLVIPELRSTIPQTSALQTAPFPPAGGSVAQVDADAFVAQARGAVANCAALRSPNTAAAAAKLSSAQGAARGGRYIEVRSDARAAVDLCAAATSARP